MRQVSALTVSALAAVSCLALSVGPAVADEGTQPAQVEYAPTMLVLDASGSMAGADPAGGTKMDAAKRATHTLIDATPDGAPIGMAVYGTNTGSTDADKPAGCRDVTVLRGPEPIDKAALGGAVDGLRPRGYTPIGTALRTAADALPRSGPHAIVLVSDGIDTCAPPDPCEVAKELSANGVDLVVHAVGFGVDESARKQLTCIARVTGGTYTDAPDARSLDRVLPRVTDAALRSYQPSGIPVTGTPEPGTAPQLKPGQYVDMFERNRRKYYAVDVPAGMTAYFTATLIYARNSNDLDIGAFEAKMYAPDGSDCSIGERDITSFAGDGEFITAPLTSDKATSTECTKPGRYTFGVLRDSDQYQADQLPVEIIVGLEPKVTGDKGQPAANRPVGFHDPGGSSRTVVGGGSFGTAATLDGTGTYTDLLHYGEYVFYRVRLDWGQGLAYRVRYGDVPERTIVNIETTLLSPFRAQVGWDTTAYGGDPTKLPASSEAIATLPIRYLNRENTERKQSVAGWFYIGVKLGKGRGEADPGTVPVSVDLVVTGQPEPGPAYAFPSEEARKAGVFGDGGPRVAKADPATGANRAEPIGQGQVSSFPTTAVLIAGGGVVLLAAVVGIVLAARRRRAHPRS